MSFSKIKEQFKVKTCAAARCSNEESKATDLYTQDLFEPIDSITYRVATNARGEFIMLKLNEEKLGKWYNGVDFENSHLITDKNHNTDLGISGIILRKPNSTGSNGRVFASVIINFVNGLTVNGSLYVDKTGKGLTFGVEQRKTDGPNPEYYDINVRVPMSIQAQVLRYATTKAVEVANVPAQQQAPAQQQYQAPVQQQAPAQTYAPQAPAANAYINPATGQALTVEEMEFMMAQGNI